MKDKMKWGGQVMGKGFDGAKDVKEVHDELRWTDVSIQQVRLQGSEQ